MTDFGTSKLDHENHLLLDHATVKLVIELLRKTLRGAHFDIEHHGKGLKDTVKEIATAAVSGRASQADTLRSLDGMITRARGLKRKLTTAAEEEARLHRGVRARVEHLVDLYDMQSVDDGRYARWSSTRLDRLLVDYMLRMGYCESARALAEEQKILDLVDVPTFEKVDRIRKSIEGGSVVEALQWCMSGDVKKELKKMESQLEFNLRFQQYIELVRQGTSAKRKEAIKHAQKYLSPYRSIHPKDVQAACGLMAVPPNLATHNKGYYELYSPDRWKKLAVLFVQTHNTLLNLPTMPLLHIALSSGLSALKTPACHSTHNGCRDASAAVEGGPGPSVSAASSTPAPSLSHGLLAASVCPICSTELNELARAVPYAHHSQSHVEPDLVMLPTGRAYGKARLEEYARKSGGLAPGQVKDLRTGDVFEASALKKVFIT